MKESRYDEDGEDIEIDEYWHGGCYSASWDKTRYESYGIEVTVVKMKINGPDFEKGEKDDESNDEGADSKGKDTNLGTKRSRADSAGQQKRVKAPRKELQSKGAKSG